MIPKAFTQESTSFASDLVKWTPDMLYVKPTKTYARRPVPIVQDKRKALMRDATTQAIHPDVLMNAITPYFEVRHVPDVAAFIRPRPYLLQLLLEAKQQIERVFGMGTKVALDLAHYGQSDDQAHLYAFVIVKLRPQEASARLDQLDAEWWLDNKIRGRGDLTVDVEFS